MPTNLPPIDQDYKDISADKTAKPPISMDPEAEKGIYDEEYLAKTAGTQGKGKRSVYVNLEAVNEPLREYLDVNWSDARIQNGANYLPENVKTGFGFVPNASTNGHFSGHDIRTTDKGYSVVFRTSEYQDLGSANDFPRRKESFYFYAKGEATWASEDTYAPDSENILYNFKNMPHFLYVVGALKHSDFISHPKYNNFSIQEKLLLDDIIDSEGPGTIFANKEKIFRDFYFELETPYTKKESQIGAAFSQKLIDGEISTTFNFDSPKYVKFSSEGGYFRVQERHLPNFYSYLSEYDACKKTLTVGGEALNIEGQTTSDLTMGGHYDQLTLGGLLPYNSIPFNVKTSGHQKMSMLDLITQQQKQHTAFGDNQNKQKYIKEGSEYLSTAQHGAPYFENFSDAFKTMDNSVQYDSEMAGMFDNTNLPADANYFEIKAAFINSYNRSVVFTRDNMKYLTDFNDKIDIFPYYVKLEIPNSTNSVLAKLLYDLDFEHDFVSMITMAAENNVTSDNAGNQQLVSTMAFSRGSETISNELDLQIPQKGFEIKETTDVRYYDLNEFMNMLVDGATAALINDPKNFVGPGGYQSVQKKIEESKQQSLNFKAIMQQMIAIGKLKNLIKKKYRTYREMLHGKQAYKEIVAYRIAKHTVSGDGVVSPLPIQNMFFMNKEDVDSIVYYDTQVKYNRKYKYIVYAYVFVIGNRYNFENPKNFNTEMADTWYSTPKALKDNVQGTDEYLRIMKDNALEETPPNFSDKNVLGFLKKFELRNRPDPRILEVPYFEFSGEYEHQLVMDNPPLHPQVTFTPYREMNNKILITLETTLGKYSAHPISILPEDGNYYSLAKLAQNKLETEPIEFKAEDSNREYQIFRIGPGSDGSTKAPFGYSDFSDKLHLTLATNTSLATLDDTIERNRTYYYMFRAIDRRGGISPPSTVYKVELVGDPNHNLSYPRISAYDMDNGKNKKSKKLFRRYLHLNPHIQHISVDGSRSGYDWNDSANTGMPPALGTGAESMVGQHNKKQKRFKIRLTSKATGRKIDFNVKFVHRHVKNV